MTSSPNFGSVAETYARVRPGYPPAVFDDLLALTGLADGASVLEIGAATGQATLPLAQRGYRVTAIEPDEALRNVFIPDSPRSPIPNGELMGEDPRLLELLNQQRTEGDVETRKALLYDLQLHVAEKMYSVPWVNGPVSQIARPELSGVQFIQTFAPAPSLEDMWFKA